MVQIQSFKLPNHLSREVSRASTAMFSSATSKSTEMHMKKVIPDGLLEKEEEIRTAQAFRLMDMFG